MKELDMTNDTNTSQTAEAGARLVRSAEEVSLVKLYGVATAFYEGIISYDPNGSNGRGRFKGGSDVVQVMADGAASVGVLPTEFTPQYVAKIARVLVDHGRYLLDLATPEVREKGCREWIVQHGDPVSFYNSVQDSKKDSDGATLSQMVANLLSWASKNDLDMASVVAEVVAQCEGKVSE